MTCDSMREKIDAYVDGSLPASETGALTAHLRECPPCAAALLDRVQMKLAVHTAGRRYSPSASLRERVQKPLPRKPSARRAWSWNLGLVRVAALLGFCFLAYFHWSSNRREQAFGELADLHVSTLASSSPVDVISTDRHTVKPWFQGKLPFTFNLPELKNSPFTLIGGRVAYLNQAPGAQLLFTIGNHRISVFIFQDRNQYQLATGDSLSEHLTFTMESWSQDDLRYFVVGDANAADIHKLSDLLKPAALP